MELSGRLKSFPIAELLHWAHNNRHTGCLVVRAAGREKRIYFRDGQIVTCTTNEPSEFYGQFLLLNGYLDQKTLLRALTLFRERGQRLGAVLQQEGMLALGDIQRTLRFHMEDVICDIFLWDHGVFFFRSEQPHTEELLAEPISPTGLALEGSHWIDEERRIRQVFVDDHVVLARSSEAPVGDMKPRLRRILEEVDGVRRLEALYGAVHGSFYRFLAGLFELHEKNLVEVAHRGRALNAWQRDAGLDDLLWEQATKEQEAERHHMVALGDLERYVPVWVRPPLPEEWERMPEAVRRFYKSFDGTQRLVELLSEEEEAWKREFELLMLQIGKEAVALLPAPVAVLREEAEERGGGVLDGLVG